jgi:arylsulfatase A-like enzyme
MFTGLMPRAAGLARAASPSAAKPVVESHHDRLLPVVLRRAGYATWAASCNLWISRDSGFDTGFDEFDDVDTGRHASLNAEQRRERLRWLIEAARAQVDDGAHAVARQIDAWLAQDGDRPFLGFVNLVECHSPYLPPRPYGRASMLDRIRAARDARRYYTLSDIWRVCSGVDRVPESSLKRLRRLYLESIRLMDDWLGRVLEQMDSAGLLDETLVIVCSDHGENLGESGLIAHALSLDERLLHVPFVAAGPGANQQELTSLAELPRFVADAVGLDDHPWHDAPATGVGVGQLDPPLTTDDGTGLAGLEKIGLGSALDLFRTPQTCAVAGGLKLLRRGTKEEVYDLKADPLEADPLAPDDERLGGRTDELARLRQALAQPAMTATPGATHSESAPPDASEDEMRDLEERMRLLGYM